MKTKEQKALDEIVRIAARATKTDALDRFHLRKALINIMSVAQTWVR